MRKIKIALTGGIGSGKSTALSCIRDMGYPVFSCDEIYKEIITSKGYVEKIENVFPQAVLSGIIDRTVLSELIFTDSKKRELLNQIAHPLIMKTLHARMNKCESALVFAEVPLLFEGNFENQFDEVIVIVRDEKMRISSVQERDHISEEEIKNRLTAQFDYFSKEGRERLQKCNAHIIKNEGSIELLYSNLKKIITTLLLQS